MTFDFRASLTKEKVERYKSEIQTVLGERAQIPTMEDGDELKLSYTLSSGSYIKVLKCLKAVITLCRDEGVTVGNTPHELDSIEEDLLNVLVSIRDLQNTMEDRLDNPATVG